MALKPIKSRSKAICACGVLFFGMTIYCQHGFIFEYNIFCQYWRLTKYSRKRREEDRNNLQQIKANMETVYNVQGDGDEGEIERI